MRAVWVLMALGGSAACRSAPVHEPPGEGNGSGSSVTVPAPTVDAARAAPPPPDAAPAPAPTIDAGPPIELRALTSLPRRSSKASALEPALARAVKACGFPFGAVQRTPGIGPACRPPRGDDAAQTLEACVDAANATTAASAASRLLERERGTRLGEADAGLCTDPSTGPGTLSAPACTVDMLRVDVPLDGAWWMKGPGGALTVVLPRTYEASRRTTMTCACSGCCGTMPMDEFGPPDEAPARPTVYQVLRTPHGAPTALIDLAVPAHVEQLDRSDTVDGKYCPAVP